MLIYKAGEINAATFTSFQKTKASGALALLSCSALLRATVSGLWMEGLLTILPM